MSATPHTHEPSVQHDLDHDPDQIFEHEIQNNRTICTRCFRRIFNRTTETRTVDSGSGGNAEAAGGYQGTIGEDTLTPAEQFIRMEAVDGVEVCWPTPGGAELPPADRRACPRARPACECGSIDQDGQRSTLSKEKALTLAERLSDRLDERGVEHDRDLLLAVVRRAKCRPNLAGQDDRIFGKAVGSAVEKGVQVRA